MIIPKRLFVDYLKFFVHNRAEVNTFLDMGLVPTRIRLFFQQLERHMKKTKIRAVACRKTTPQDIHQVYQELTTSFPVDHTCTAPNAAQHKLDREKYLVRNRRKNNG